MYKKQTPSKSLSAIVKKQRTVSCYFLQEVKTKTRKNIYRKGSSTYQPQSLQVATQLGTTTTTTRRRREREQPWPWCRRLATTDGTLTDLPSTSGEHNK